MTAPATGSVFVVRPDAITALGAELAALAAELAGEAERCRAAGPLLASAWDGGDEGWTASLVAGVWATLLETIATRTDALGGGLVSIAESYRVAESARADRIPAYLTGAHGSAPR